MSSSLNIVAQAFLWTMGGELRAEMLRHKGGGDGALDECQRSATLNVCNQFQRGLRTVEDAAETIILACIEPFCAAGYVSLLPDEIRAALPAVLATLPVSDEEWLKFNRIGQFDGNDWTRVRTVLESRANTEAIRESLTGEISPPSAPDFVERLRASYRAEMEKFRLMKGES